MLLRGHLCLCLSYSWCTSRMDRNMITVLTGQVVDFFDRDFREMYAISKKLDLYKEFHVSRPAANVTSTVRSKTGSIRPPLPATTSRFQVTLGDSRNAVIQVPAHKFYNPKYSLAFGDIPRPTGSLQEPGPKRGSVLAHVPEDMDLGNPRVTSSEKMDRLSPQPSETPSEISKRLNGVTQSKKSRFTLKPRLLNKKPSSKLSVDSSGCPSPTETHHTDENEDSFEVVVLNPSKVSKKPSKLGRKTASEQSVNHPQDNESKSQSTNI